MFPHLPCLPLPTPNAEADMVYPFFCYIPRAENATFYLINDLINIERIECKMPAAQKNVDYDCYCNKKQLKFYCY